MNSPAVTVPGLDDVRPRSEPAAPLFAALDIGGTKIAGALIDGAGTVLHRARRPTPAKEPGGVVLAAVHEVIEQLATDPGWDQVAGLGIGSAGPVDCARGTVSPVNIPGWRGFPLVRSVSQHPAVDGLPVRLGGDAVAMAAAEHWCGAARGYRNALCVVVSTGVGAGLILGGAVHPGPSGNAGHLGHISVDLDGEPCPCGARGCVERIASGPAIVRRALTEGWRPDPAAAADPSAADVAASAHAGDPAALAAFDRAAQALAAAVAATATLLEIETAVIGGGVAQAGEILFTPLRRHLATYAALPFAAIVTAQPAQLGQDAGLVGAAALAMVGVGI